jgi:hypothetical protein
LQPTVSLTCAAIGTALLCLTLSAHAADTHPGAVTAPDAASAPQATGAFSAESTLNTVTVAGNRLDSPNDAKFWASQASLAY